MNTPKALVLRAPGINCDRETAHACRVVGFDTDLLHINYLLKAPDRLLDYHFLVFPGGFSYGDDLGAGTLLAKNLTIHLGKQLYRFIDEGRSLLGICNGFQVLVRAGLLPCHLSNAADSSPTDPTVPGVPSVPTFYPASLTDNASAQFECRWVTLAVQPGPCIFTQGIERPIELPVAHGEGQFVLAHPALLTSLQASGQIPLLYTINSIGVRSASPSSAAPSSLSTVSYPDNPNGSIGNIAGICNAQGNVFGLMPHPERYVHALQHPQRQSIPGTHGPGDGLLIFKNAYEYASRFVERSSQPPGSPNPHQPDESPINVRRGEGGVERKGGPLWSPAVPGWSSFAPQNQHLTTGDHKGPLHPSQPLSPLRTDAAISSVDVYASSGVDIAAAAYAKELMQDAIRTTHGPEVLAGMGAFAGIFNASGIQQMRRPALVASTDGVGTKTLVAVQAGRFDTIGFDLVNHSVNDLLTAGAAGAAAYGCPKPLFFMDYLAMGRLDPVRAATIVRGVASACQEVGCALLGGETAEMPDVYLPEAFDLAGTIVGVVEQESAVNGASICAGDVLLGLPSSGLHTNGYSLARRVFAPYPLETVFLELGEPLVDALLRPHRCYLHEIQLLKERSISIKGIAHITGGGFAGNIVRILPARAQAVIETSAWSAPPLFRLLGRLGRMAREEMYRALNMGVGMVLVFSAEAAVQARAVLPQLLTVGYVTEGDGVVLK